jgi:hypothetical protein
MFLSLILARSLRSYLDFYQDYALDKWRHLTPMQYGVLLISVGVFGWLLMKSANRK